MTERESLARQLIDVQAEMIKLQDDEILRLRGLCHEMLGTMTALQIQTPPVVLAPVIIIGGQR